MDLDAFGDILGRLLADLPSTAILAYLVWSLVRILDQLLDAHIDHVERAVVALEAIGEFLQRLLS